MKQYCYLQFLFTLRLVHFGIDIWFAIIQMIQGHQYVGSLEQAKELDEKDPLKSYRSEFNLPHQEHPNSIYFCGNSLGAQPKKAEEVIATDLKSWKDLAIGSFLDSPRPWLSYTDDLIPIMADMVGAQTQEVVLMNTLSVNIHLLMVSFYRPTKQKYMVVIEKGCFPSDRYAIDSQIKFHGFDPATGVLELAPREGEQTLRTEDIQKALIDNQHQISLILLGAVNYYTGQYFDLQKITQVGHSLGITVGFDLAHATGNVPIQLHDWDVDFAMWCHYKYCNGGPGVIGGAFIHEKHLKEDLPQLQGWWGSKRETRFKMEPKFDPQYSAKGWEISAPPIMSTAPLVASLSIFKEAKFSNIRAKSVKLTGYLQFLLLELKSENIRIITPSNPKERGCQLSVQVKNANKDLFYMINEQGITLDWRNPDVIRVAPTPLYNTFEEVYRFVGVLKDCLLKIQNGFVFKTDKQYL